MQYVKLINNTIEYAPKNKGSILNYNKDIELMTQDGYKPFYPIERPETKRGFHVEYDETDDKISEVLVYDETQEQADERIAQAERERISKLSMTKYDFYKLVCKPNDIEYQDLITMVNSNDEVAAAWNLCERIYRGDETLCKYVKQFIPSITDDELDRIFLSIN